MKDMKKKAEGDKWMMWTLKWRKRGARQETK